MESGERPASIEDMGLHLQKQERISYVTSVTLVADYLRSHPGTFDLNSVKTWRRAHADVLVRQKG